MKKLLFLTTILMITISAFAQDSTGTRKSSKQEKRQERRQKINTMIRQDEEGVMAYHKQNIFGIQLRSLGYGLLYEIGRTKTTRKTTTYSVELSEIKSQKEEKLPTGGFFIGNRYIYGKINNFYQFKLGIGQQYILGEKGNKNGVSVSAVYGGGLSLGFLRPYYLQVQDASGNQVTIKYSQQDSALFTGNSILAGGGLGKGWGELKLRPGAYGKAGLRFDYGRFNEMVSAIEVGVSVDAYLKKIPIMLFQKEKQLFFQGYIALEFGRRK
ncbi:MAG: hypothetical protein JWM28_4143 [Chitinophagaceae bacterium]|nr:hypothetical protein [Chitinophagaceae bacterium]